METDNKFIPNQEQIKFVYHGSTAGNITEFEPRKRYTPNGLDVPARVYASPNPAFAAAHSFPWSSDEGIDVTFDEGKTVLVVPEKFKDKLEQKVYIYKIDGSNFKPTKEEGTGETYHSEEHVSPQETIAFESVTSAIEYFGGHVHII